MTWMSTLRARTAAGGSSAAFITAAATTHTPWLYGLAVVSAVLPWLGSMTWRCVFATKPAEVRTDLLELMRIEGGVVGGGGRGPARRGAGPRQR
jgi:hypothetical protein